MTAHVCVAGCPLRSLFRLFLMALYGYFDSSVKCRQVMVFAGLI
jgi:hypothetical protein